VLDGALNIYCILKLLGRPYKDWKSSILNTDSKQTALITLQWAMLMNGSFLAEYYSRESKSNYAWSKHYWLVSSLIQHRISCKHLFIVPQGVLSCNGGKSCTILHLNTDIQLFPESKLHKLWPQIINNNNDDNDDDNNNK
jgi:hypothetical protein